MVGVREGPTVSVCLELGGMGLEVIVLNQKATFKNKKNLVIQIIHYDRAHGNGHGYGNGFDNWGWPSQGSNKFMFVSKK